ncbi:MAG: hypothetical protein AAFO07_05365, partial [Bacteroidota bacterium]
SEKRTATRSQGIVAEDQNFYIDFKTLYQGTIRLSSDSKNLFFDGFAKLDADKLPLSYWFSVKSEGDKKDLAIAFDKPLSPDGDRLATGIFLSKETMNAYPSIMMPLMFRKDRPILPVKGYFKYDNKEDDFIFGDSTKVMADQVRGNKLVFKNKSGEIEGEGKLEIGSGLKLIQVAAGGTLTTKFPKNFRKPKEEKPVQPDDNMMMLAEPEEADTVNQEPPPPLDIKMMAAITMAVPDKLLKIAADDIISSSFATPNVSYLTDLEFYKMAAQQVLPDIPEVAEAISFMSSGYLELPKRVNPYSFFFSLLEMEWDAEYQSFIPKGDKIGLASLDGIPINKMVEGFIEFKMPTNEDDRLYIYLKSPGGYFYYFGYKQGILDITSDNPDFTETIFKIKPKDLIVKMPDGSDLEIQPVEQSKARLFLRRIEYVQKNKKK